MNSPLCLCLRKIFDAALTAVAPDGALLRHVHRDGHMLRVAGQAYDLTKGKVIVLGGGKGAAPMAMALENMLGDYISEGIVVVKYGHGLPLRHIRQNEASHPVPDAAGLHATRQMLELAATATAHDLAICLFTGGASALTPAPAEGISLEDLQQCTALLLECGATINELNAVRKHLSLFSGGQLARTASPAPVLSFMVSDVVGDDLDVIASGPTAPDKATFADCCHVVEKFALQKRLPQAVWARLQAGNAGHITETPKPQDALFSKVHNVLVATNRQALDAAAEAARHCGYEARIITDKLTGEARDKAVELVAEARQVAATLHPGDKPVCLLAGGETTVTIRGKGKGGRNQEMALAAAIALENDPRIVALFAGTDGTDGPTDAAGGFALGTSLAAIAPHGEACAFLDANDSYAALRLSDTLLITGPTRTNVMDMAILLVHPAA